MTPSLQTLFLPLENGDVAPGSGRTLFMGAAAHSFLSHLNADSWQPYKPLATDKSVPDLPDGHYTLALVHLPKQVEEAKYWLSLAMERLEKGGILLAAAANDAGGSRIEGWFEQAGLAPTAYSKNKARAVWAVKSAAAQAPPHWKSEGEVRSVAMEEGLIFKSQPGLFSWNRIDAASRFLAAHFPPALSGRVADFGCGCGYLSYQALKNYPKITSLTLVEADSRALACAKENIEPVRGDREVQGFWHDATRPMPGVAPFDHILMNPPFHAGKKTDIALGIGFLTNAAANLKRNGALSLVANVHLPYEATLEGLFKNVKQVAVEGGFKILRAIK